jgi:hypothetical protein
LRPNARVIATSGVSCAHTEIIEGARGYNTLIAFDADHRTNAAVCRQLARLVADREQDSARLQFNTQTKIVFWDGPKGIDEAAQADVPLTAITIQEWYATLTEKSLEEVNKVWAEMKHRP